MLMATGSLETQKMAAAAQSSTPTPQQLKRLVQIVNLLKKTPAPTVYQSKIPQSKPHARTANRIRNLQSKPQGLPATRQKSQLIVTKTREDLFHERRRRQNVSDLETTIAARWPTTNQ